MLKFLFLKLFFTVLFIFWCLWNIEGLLLSIIDSSHFLFEMTIVFFIYILPVLIILFFLSLSLRKSETKWQRVIGNIGLVVVVLDLLINVIAFIWNLIS